MCSPIFHDAAHPSRAKLLKIWEWLQSQRSLNAQVIGEIKKDITMLPEITNFAEAINIISAMNQLQSELITLRAQFLARRVYGVVKDGRTHVE